MEMKGRRGIPCGAHRPQDDRNRQKQHGREHVPFDRRRVWGIEEWGLRGWSRLRLGCFVRVRRKEKGRETPQVEIYVGKLVSYRA